MIKVKGDTYRLRRKLRSYGAWWDERSRYWKVPATHLTLEAFRNFVDSNDLRLFLDKKDLSYDHNTENKREECPECGLKTVYIKKYNTLACISCRFSKTLSPKPEGVKVSKRVDLKICSTCEEEFDAALPYHSEGFVDICGDCHRGDDEY